jgi:hypothetical protein
MLMVVVALGPVGSRKSSEAVAGVGRRLIKPHAALGPSGSPVNPIATF